MLYVYVCIFLYTYIYTYPYNKMGLTRYICIEREKARTERDR